MNDNEPEELERVLQDYRDVGYLALDVTQWERDFMSDTIERFEKYGATTRVSEKQWAVLRRIHEKLPL